MNVFNSFCAGMAVLIATSSVISISEGVGVYKKAQIVPFIGKLDECFSREKAVNQSLRTKEERRPNSPVFTRGCALLYSETMTAFLVYFPENNDIVTTLHQCEDHTRSTELHYLLSQHSIDEFNTLLTKEVVHCRSEILKALM